MDRLAVHLVWSGALITATSHAAYASIVIHGPPEVSNLVVPALLSLAGPLTALMGFFVARNGQRSYSHAEPQPRTESLPEPEAKVK